MDRAWYRLKIVDLALFCLDPKILKPVSRPGQYDRGYTNAPGYERFRQQRIGRTVPIARYVNKGPFGQFRLRVAIREIDAAGSRSRIPAFSRPYPPRS